MFHQVIDVWGYKRWTPVFVWIGANAITLYLLNALMGFDEPARRIAGGDFGVMLDKVFARGVGELLVNLDCARPRHRARRLPLPAQDLHAHLAGGTHRHGRRT